MRSNFLRLGFFLFGIDLAFGSYGDRTDPIFTRCIRKCEGHCQIAEKGEGVDYQALDGTVQGQVSFKSFTIFERMMNWDCHEDCKYKCMWISVEHNKKLGYFVDESYNLDPVQQYYGKWPFARIMGMQEPASALFSLFNAGPHLDFLHFAMKSRRTEKASKIYIKRWSYFAMTGVFVWVSSAVFHCRDFPLTEKLDYGGAVLNIYVGSICALIDLIIYKTGKNVANLCFIIGFFSFCLHFFVLLGGRVNYRWNIFVSSCVQIIGVLCFLVRYWNGMLEAFRGKGSFHVKSGLFSHLSILSAAMVFEVYFDFPPFFYIFDAHSIWHLCTVLSGILWFKFIKSQAEMEAASKIR